MDTLKITPDQPNADLRMMGTPDLWPHDSFLPLVRQGGGHGVLISKPGLPTVFMLNIFDARLGGLLQGDQGDEDPSVKAEVFENLAAVVAAGWRVD
jgi:hypothetical protein